MGFHGIEIMSGQAGGARPGDFASDDPNYLRSVVSRAKSLGIKITCLAPYNDFAFTKNEQWRRDNVQYVKTWTRIAGDLGVENLRLCTGYWVEGEDRQKLRDLVESGIAECLPVAEASNVNLCLENHSAVFLPLEETLGLLRRLHSTRLTACVDATNWSGEFFKRPVGDEVREGVLRDAAVYVRHATNAHLKVPGVEGEHLTGWGSDLERLLTSYAAAGYRGPVAFESIATGDLLGAMRKAREIVEAAMRQVTAP